jgi:hypothetical protein
MLDKSTPNSRANFLIEGEACDSGEVVTEITSSTILFDSSSVALIIVGAVSTIVVLGVLTL